MKWFIEPKALGGGLLAAGPLLIQFGGSKATWWIGLVCSIVGPVLLAMRRRRGKA